jgi:hypothetical protein
MSLESVLAFDETLKQLNNPKARRGLLASEYSRLIHGGFEKETVASMSRLHDIFTRYSTQKHDFRPHAAKLFDAYLQKKDAADEAHFAGEKSSAREMPTPEYHGPRIQMLTGFRTAHDAAQMFHYGAAEVFVEKLRAAHGERLTEDDEWRVGKTFKDLHDASAAYAVSGDTAQATAVLKDFGVAQEFMRKKLLLFSPDAQEDFRETIALKTAHVPALLETARQYLPKAFKTMGTDLEFNALFANAAEPDVMVDYFREKRFVPILQRHLREAKVPESAVGDLAVYFNNGVALAAVYIKHEAQNIGGNEQPALITCRRAGWPSLEGGLLGFEAHPFITAYTDSAMSIMDYYGRCPDGTFEYEAELFKGDRPMQVRAFAYNLGVRAGLLAVGEERTIIEAHDVTRAFKQVHPNAELYHEYKQAETLAQRLTAEFKSVGRGEQSFEDAFSNAGFGSDMVAASYDRKSV